MTVLPPPIHQHTGNPLSDRPQRHLVMIRPSWAIATAPRRNDPRSNGRHVDDRGVVDQVAGDISCPHPLQQRAA